MTSGPSGSRYGGRRQGNGHKSMVVRALERGNVTEPKYQKQFVEEAKNAGLSTAIFTPVNVVAGTLTSIGVWIALNPQTFDEKLIDAAISATPGVVVGSAVGVAQTLFSKYREVRKASKQAVKDRAEGKDPDTEPLDKFKQHDDAIAAQARKHRGLLGVTSRAIRALSQRLTGTNQRVDALQAQFAAELAAVRQESQSQLAAQRQYFEGRLAQQDHTIQARFAAGERRVRSEFDAHTSGVRSRLDRADERLDRHDSGLGLAQSGHNTNAARIDQLEQRARQQPPPLLPPADVARGQDLLNHARRSRDEQRAVPPSVNPPTPGQPYNQPPAPPSPHRPRQ
ncbi:hypothetical protein GCM10009765_67620 [Fodinicola feengrottensis]|uniref:Uncharacterized protein n=1 Tax=Fodinicola feengrottensis TaxID=435914 RepID=A0ABN2INF3_9ACTN